MATTDAQQMNFVGVAPGGLLSDERKSEGYRHWYPAGARDFFVEARTRDGLVTDLSEHILNMTWDESLEDVVTSGTIELDNTRDIEGKRLSQVVGKGTRLVLTVRNPMSGRIEEKDQFVIFTRSRGVDGVMRCTFFSDEKYLLDSKVTVLYTKGKRKRHWNATEITKHLCRTYGIKLARFPKQSKRSIPYLYQEEEPLLDILVRLWTLEAKASKQRYVIKMIKGQLHIITKPKTPRADVLELGNDLNDSGILTDISSEDSIEGVVTVLRLWGTAKEFSDGTTDTRNAVVKSKQYASRAGVATWGRIYLEKPMAGIQTKAEIERLAKVELKKLAKSKYEATAEIMGYPSIRAGAAIRVHETQSGVSGLFWFKTLSHSVSGDGTYTARGTLVRYEYTKTLATEPDDLKPDSVSTDGSTGSVGDLAKSSAIPTEVWNILRAASVKAGVPQEWANSKALEQLLQHESGFRWTAQNPGSTAYGLFQFLNTTWDDWDTGVTKEQSSPGYSKDKPMLRVEGVGWITKWKYNMCVGGLNYIQKRYGTPEKAWAYWQANRSY